MPDELSLLEATTIEEILSLERPPKVRVVASNKTPAPDFTGSLDFIDSLPSRPALSAKWRDIAGITTFASPYVSQPEGRVQNVPTSSVSNDALSLSTDFRPLQDGRRYDPQGSYSRPAAFHRSAARVISTQRLSPVSRKVFPPGYPEGIEVPGLTPRQNRYFNGPNGVVTCLKRKIRKQVINASGFGGMNRLKNAHKPRRNFWSRVFC